MALIDNLLAYWKFDETTGSAIDATGNYNGKVNGATLGASGIINTGYSFDGVNDSITITGISSTAKNYTFSFWAKAAGKSYTGDRQFIDFQTGRLLIYSCRNSTDNLGYFDGTVRDFGTSLIVGSYAHYVFLFDDVTDKGYLYINGSKNATELAYAAKNLDGISTIGQNFIYSENSSYEGLLDECGIWERVLTSGEILELYNSGNGFAYPFSAAGSDFISSLSDTLTFADSLISQKRVNNLISTDLNSDHIYIHSGASSTVIGSFASPGAYPGGVIVINNNLISSDLNSDHIYIHSGVSSTLTGSFASPGTSPKGLASNNNNLISANGALGGDNYIYIHSGVSSTLTGSFDLGTSNVYDICTDEDGNLIANDYNGEIYYIYSGISNTITGSIIPVDVDTYGITVKNNDLYSFVITNKYIYHHSGLSDVLIGSFIGPNPVGTAFPGALTNYYTDASDITNYLEQLSDTLSLFDSYSKNSIFNRTQSDSLSLTDSYSQVASYNRTASDSLAFEDNLIKSLSFNRTASDSITFDDSLTKNSIFNRTASDSLTINDDLSKSSIFNRTLSDSVTLTDNVLALKQILLSFSDSISLVDDLSIYTGLSAVLFDSVGVSDNLLTQKTIQRNISDSVSFLDNLEKSVNYLRENSDTVGITDSLEQINNFLYSLIESFSLDDNLTRQSNYNRTISEILSIVDSLRAGGDLSALLSDSVGMSDSVVTLLAEISNVLSKIYRLGLTKFDNKLIKNDSVIKLRKGGNLKLK